MLICTVRDCKLPLQHDNRSLRCSAGHCFDIARSGYFNLLQPQDRRSLNPGDHAKAVAARESLLELGYEDLVVAQIATILRPIEQKITVLDVGCGTGYHLTKLAEQISIDASGMDISTLAIDKAAKRSKKLSWIVANADILLPWSNSCFDLLLSITSRKNPLEFQRVLKKEGRLILVVPGKDDLIELRNVVMGSRIVFQSREKNQAVFKSHFEFLFAREVKQKVLFTKEKLNALLASTYRGERRSQSDSIQSLSEMEVTLSREIMVFKPL